MNRRGRCLPGIYSGFPLPWPYGRYSPFSMPSRAAEIGTGPVVCGSGGESGFPAHPKEGGKHPAFILIHEGWGRNDNIRNNARRFAGQGHAARAVDLYGGRVAASRDEVRALAGEVRENRDRASLASAVDSLKGRGTGVGRTLFFRCGTLAGA